LSVTFMPPAVSFDTVTPAAVRSLLEPQSGPCLSVYLPTHRRPPHNTVDLPTFRQLVRSLEAALRPAQRRDEIERLLHPLETLAADARFWEHVRDGLAVLATGGHASVFLLQRPVRPLALVGERFHTLPLVRLAAAAERFHVLALTSRSARLTEAMLWSDPQGSRIEGLDPVPLHRPHGGTTHVLERGDVVDEEIFQPHRVQRGLGIEGIVHGGVGSKQDDIDADTEIFLRGVDEAVHEQAGRRSAVPLLLVASPRLAARFRSLSKSRLLLAEDVPKDPHLMSETDLAAAVATVLGSVHRRRVARELQAFFQARDHDLASADLAEVSRAAVAGRVAMLLLEVDRFEHGRFDRATGGIEPATAAAVPGEDLFGSLAETVLAHGGGILTLARNDMPSESGVAAVYRY
jgi:hypothetical protein